MFKSFAAALLLSSQFALTEAKRGGKGFKADDRLFAKCELTGNPADPSSISGLFLLDQADADSMIKVKGRVDLGAENEDTRALAITENAFDMYDCDNNGDIFNPFTAADATVSYDSLRDILFAADGIGYYEHRDKLTTLFDDDSVLGRSISLYEMEDQSGFIEACCTITEITRQEYR